MPCSGGTQEMINGCRIRITGECSPYDNNIPEEIT